MGKEEIDHMAIDDSHPEKDLGRSSDEPETHLAETTGRRPSVAANIIKNPLKDDLPEKVYNDAKEFANSHGLAEHAALFGRAALVAKFDDNLDTTFREIKVLDNGEGGDHDAERTALQYEIDHKWHGPKMLWYAISLCAVGAATQGWDQTGSNGANLSFPQALGIDSGSRRDQWLQGLINSIIFLTAGLIGAFIVDPLNHYLGRRGEIFVTAACLTATPIGSAFAQTWQSLFWARFIMGIGIGAKNATVPIYSAEMAPHRVRGALVMFWQLWVVAGIFLGLIANIAVKDTGDISWRLQFGSAFIPSFVLMCGIWFCPESPRWLMKKGRHAEAFQAMNKLRAHPIIAARDFYYSHILYVEELKVARGAGYFQRLWDCFSVPRIRRANYGASTVMIAQQMCGINIISFYSSTIFEDILHDSNKALYASLGYGAIQVVFTIPTLFLIDTKGRRTLCLITFPLMCIFLLAAGLSLLIKGDGAAKLGPVALFIYLFTICYSLGEGPVAFQYSAEVFPTIQREQGMAWAVCINNTFAGVLSLTFFRLRANDVLGPTGSFGFYAGLNAVAWVMIFCFVRETKQLTLEEIDDVFKVPTSKYIKHELTVWLPYFIKRHVLRKNIPKPPPLIGKADEPVKR